MTKKKALTGGNGEGFGDTIKRILESGLPVFRLLHSCGVGGSKFGVVAVQKIKFSSLVEYEALSHELKGSNTNDELGHRVKSFG